jgi:hypothetical protein
MSNVNHPGHYGGELDPYETIKVLEAKLSPDEFRGFCKGNAIKYLDRAGKKDKAKLLEDFEKAGWYIARYAAHLRADRAAAGEDEDTERRVPRRVNDRGERL